MFPSVTLGEHFVNPGPELGGGSREAGRRPPGHPVSLWGLLRMWGMWAPLLNPRPLRVSVSPLSRFRPALSHCSGSAHASPASVLPSVASASS